MNCPRCRTTIAPPADPDAIITCPACAARLMTRSAALRSQGGPGRSARAVSSQTPAENASASARTPTGPADAIDARQDVAAPAATAATASAPAPPAAPVTAAAPATPEAASQVTLETLLGELRALRALQERIVSLLERGGTAPAQAGDEPTDGPPLTPIRTSRRKSVVLIDDDDATREAAVGELQRAEIPVRAFADGNAALSAIAEDKPDVIALELGLAGAMEGRDLVNMIKATMEWIDIPIVLWTREPVASQRDARQLHGADELVAKASGAQALVTRVISLFRRVH